MGQDAHAEWKKRVERWGDSGLSAKEYAAEIGVNPATLRHWKWRLRSETRGGGAKPTSQGSSAQFIEFIARVPEEPKASQTVRSGPQHDPMELIFPSGLRLRVPPSFDPEVLRRLIATVEGS